MFPVVELPAGGVTVAQVCLGADVGSAKALGELLTFVINPLAFLVGRLRSNTARHDDDLHASHPWGKDESLIVTVDHDHDTDGPGRKAPGILPDVNFSLTDRVVGVLYEDIKHVRIRKVGSEAVRGAALNTTTGGRDETLNSGRIESTSKFFLFGLDTWDDRDRKELLVHAAIEVKDL